MSPTAPGLSSPSAGYAAFRGSRYYPALDGLRAVSIVLVVVWHAHGVRWWFLSGYTGVNIFFVLSGFLIHTLLLREEEAEGTVWKAGFYLRRCFRILPLYLTVLAVYVVVLRAPSLAEQAAQFRVALPYYLTAMNDFAPFAPYNQSWSLGVEEKFYFCSPLLFFVLLPRVRREVMAVLIAGPMLLAIHFQIAWVAPYGMILVGCLLAEILNRPASFAAIERRGWLLPMALGLWIALHLLLGIFPDRSHLLFGYLLFGYVLNAAMVVAVLVVRPSWLGRLLGSGFAVWVGRRSYGIYLVHLLCLSVAERLLLRIGLPRDPYHGLLLPAVTLVYSAVVAGVLYWVLEQPAIALGQRLNRRWRPRRVESGTQPA